MSGLTYTSTEPPVIHVGIDPSYSAFAMVAHVTGPKENGHHQWLWDFSPSKAGRAGARLRCIQATLRDAFGEIHSHGRIAVVALEGYAPGRTQNREVMGELGGVVKMVLDEEVGDGRVFVVAPTALKKFVTGSGSAPKDNVLLQVYKKWGVEFRSNDVADAFGLMQVARALNYGAERAYEQEVIKSLLAKQDNG